ncbi:MAG: hypothetical protein JXA46_18100 [Dehalococcoidales bacterium]|nr:hypothetical protein [Dehalococcoidales bacterium]
MAYCLPGDVQLRKESWGLLFYSQNQHRLFFVKSREWLSPFHFDGTWSFDRLAGDIVQRTGASQDQVKETLGRTIEKLLMNGFVIHELS